MVGRLSLPASCLASRIARTARLSSTGPMSDATRRVLILFWTSTTTTPPIPPLSTLTAQRRTLTMVAPRLPAAEIHCPCQASDPTLSYPSRPSSSTHFHPMQDLYFCEECDALRCDSCVQVEISCYFCPHCLFEVPNASVRAELNR